MMIMSFPVFMNIHDIALFQIHMSRFSKFVHRVLRIVICLLGTIDFPVCRESVKLYSFLMAKDWQGPQNFCGVNAYGHYANVCKGYQ